MKYSYLFLSLFLIVSCTSKPDMEDVEKLNGFWEIEKAETPYGDKSYEMNQMVDYIEVEGTTGFRKKMQPSLLGNYKSSNNREQFSVELKNDSLVLIYKNKYDTWKETIITIDKDKFVIKNKQNFIYTYKKHQPRNINIDEE